MCQGVMSLHKDKDMQPVASPVGLSKISHGRVSHRSVIMSKSLSLCRSAEYPDLLAPFPAPLVFVRGRSDV